MQSEYEILIAFNHNITVQQMLSYRQVTNFIVLSPFALKKE